MTAIPGSRENPIPRRAARVLLLDAEQRVLLFRGFDPARPERRYWFTTGGGLDEGETSRAAAVRELREETGLSVAPEELRGPEWEETTDYPFDGRWYRQNQEFFVLRVASWEVSLDGLDELERDTIDDYRWWSEAELRATEERFYPRDLPDRLAGLR